MVLCVYLSCQLLSSLCTESECICDIIDLQFHSITFIPAHITIITKSHLINMQVKVFSMGMVYICMCSIKYYTSNCVKQTNLLYTCITDDVHTCIPLPLYKTHLTSLPLSALLSPSTIPATSHPPLLLLLLLSPAPLLHPPHLTPSLQHTTQGKHCTQTTGIQCTQADVYIYMYVRTVLCIVYSIQNSLYMHSSFISCHST